MPVLLGCAQLAVCPEAGIQENIELIQDAALVWEEDRIVWVGQEKDVPELYRDWPREDAGGRLVVPGLIDCHTHLLFSGWRSEEFCMRIAGRDYIDIAKAGGGILSTIAKTRETSKQSLKDQAKEILLKMSRLGITTVECKSGYALSDKELELLEVVQELEQIVPQTLVSTFLGAHTVPPEFKEYRQEYVDWLCDDCIPKIAERGLAKFCDAFVEEGAFSIAEASQIFQAAQKHRFEIKLHADQMSDTGGAELAARFKAVSADHLEFSSESGIQTMAEAGVVAVNLPLSAQVLQPKQWMDVRRWIDAEVPVAIATDFNPGTAPSYHLPLAMFLACTQQKMLPTEVLKATTINAAKALKLEETHGSLEVGKRADFIIIDSPDLNHWMYHFRDNACVKTVIAGQVV